MKLFPKSFEFKTDIETVTREGFSWECWTVWVWTWTWCVPGVESFWYDGQHDIVRLGFATLYKGSDTNYHERRPVGVPPTNPTHPVIG